MTGQLTEPGRHDAQARAVKVAQRLDGAVFPAKENEPEIAPRFSSHGASDLDPHGFRHFEKRIGVDDSCLDTDFLQGIHEFLALFIDNRLDSRSQAERVHLLLPPLDGDLELRPVRLVDGFQFESDPDHLAGCRSDRAKAECKQAIKPDGSFCPLPLHSSIGFPVCDPFEQPSPLQTKSAGSLALVLETFLNAVHHAEHVGIGHPCLRRLHDGETFLK